MFTNRITTLCRQACQVKCFRNFSVTVNCQQQTESHALNHTIVDLKDGVQRITLNSIKKRNALSLAMLNELKHHFTNIDVNTRVVVIAHSGPVFSAGHDLKELQSDRGSKYHCEIFQRCTEVMNLVQDVHVPVIAEVNGVATAAGCQLVATCDLAIATTKSTFAVPGVHIGLFCSTPGVALARAVNRKQALKMLFTGDSIDAQEALEQGLLNEVVSEDDLQDTTQRYADKIIRHSGDVISLGKKTFYQQIKEDRNQAYCLAENVMVENLTMHDSQEGIDAFFAKRKPTWKQ